MTDRVVNNSVLPTVVIVATGGTIASSGSSGTQLTDYSLEFSAQEIIDSVPALTEYAQIRAEQLYNVPSCMLSIANWLELARRITSLLDSDDVNGVVVTHGTDTLEETAYFLHLAIHSSKPVVLVGAMRPATAISADGPLNLLQAVAVAASPKSTGKGVLAVLNGEIHSARYISKTNTTQVQTFTSHDMGCLGYVVNYTPEFYTLCARRHTQESQFAVALLQTLPKVEIVYCYVNQGLEALEAILASGTRGIVVAGSGNGSFSTSMRAMLSKAVLQDGVVVVRASRTGSGIVSRKSIDDTESFVVSDSLNPQKARVLLMLALTVTSDPKQIQQFFAVY